MADQPLYPICRTPLVLFMNMSRHNTACKGCQLEIHSLEFISDKV